MGASPVPPCPIALNRPKMYGAVRENPDKKYGGLTVSFHLVGREGLFCRCGPAIGPEEPCAYAVHA